MKSQYRTSYGHHKPVSSISKHSLLDCAPLIRYPGVIYTGSWDQTIATHDIRASTPRTDSFSTPERVYYMDAFGHNLVVAMAGRKFNIYDIRMMERPKQERESSLRFMTGAVACMLNGEGASLFAPSFSHHLPDRSLILGGGFSRIRSGVDRGQGVRRVFRPFTGRASKEICVQVPSTNY